MTITPLKDLNAQPDQDVVEVLEEALAKARSGELRSVAIVGTLTGHATYTDHSTRDLQEAIGITSYLHHTLCARMHDNRID